MAFYPLLISIINETKGKTFKTVSVAYILTHIKKEKVPASFKATYLHSGGPILQLITFLGRAY